MTRTQLLRAIRRLEPECPMTTAFERALGIRDSEDNIRGWYKSQRQHWIGWLNEYSGPGYYCRKTTSNSAQVIYNRIVCPPMVLWLGEASGVPKARIAKAKRVGLAEKTLAARSAAVRRIIPWDEIETRLTDPRVKPTRRRS